MKKDKNPATRRPRRRAPKRPRAWQHDVYPWSLRRIPEELNVDGDMVPHPGRRSAIFVVHGMGKPSWSQTAAILRSGFEDAAEQTEEWQKTNMLSDTVTTIPMSPIPSPYISDGYWGNYTDLAQTFPDDWKRFNEKQQDFFSKLWHLRTLSGGKTYGWFLKQTGRLLNPKVAREVGIWAWLLYLPLQIVSFVTLTLSLVRYPKILTQFLADVRLYLDPHGMVERAICQNIDHRVGEAFLRMIGLDWEFRPLPPDRQIQASGKPVSFDRVVWIAHSLGSVVSYNVLSDLFDRAASFESSEDASQRDGVRRFRKSLRRFVTIGSPLDKAAFLFPERSLKPWPCDGEGRRSLLDGGETLKDSDGSTHKEWWINFYHVLDPVSGALSNPYICGDKTPPSNIHIRLANLPGAAHVAYWKDSRVLRFVLTRTYGKRFLRDREYRPRSALLLSFLAAMAYLIWGAILVGLVVALVWWLWSLVPWV
jgi:hypothetical protein